ncbi:hypothetical protein D3C78_1508570 [compost metagenome]
MLVYAKNLLHHQHDRQVAAPLRRGVIRGDGAIGHGQLEIPVDQAFGVSVNDGGGDVAGGSGKTHGGLLCRGWT